MSIYSIPPLIAGSLLICIGLFVISRNPKSIVNVTFVLECFSACLWLFGYTIMYSTKNETFAIWCAKCVYTGAAFIYTFFYHFTIAFLDKINERKNIIITSYVL